MRLLHREEEEGLVLNQRPPAQAKSGKRHRPANIPARIQVPVKRPGQPRIADLLITTEYGCISCTVIATLVIEERAGVERLVAQEVVGAAPISCAPLDDVDNGTAIVPEFAP